MRLFAAVPLPPAATEAALAVLHRWRALDWPVRWVRDEGLHVTLKFFGEVTPDRCDTIAEMLQFAVEGMHPMSLALAGGTAFPSFPRARLLGLAVSAEPGLELLQDRIERGGERIGFPPEGRPFLPHVTLGRVREGQRLPLAARAEFDDLALELPFLADRLVLYESELGAAGPRYSVRLELPFAD